MADSITGLTWQQTAMNYPYYYYLCVPTGVLFILWLLVTGISLWKQTTYIENEYWGMLFALSVFAGIVFMGFAYFLKRDCQLSAGSCSVNCGIGQYQGRSISKAPMFGGHCPPRASWNGVTCTKGLCPTAGIGVVQFNPIPFTVLSNFNINGRTAQCLYFIGTSTPTTVGKNDKVKFSDLCTFNIVNPSTNNYTIMTTTGFLSTSSSGTVVQQTVVNPSKVSGNPDSQGNVTDTYGLNNLTVQVLTKADGTQTKVAQLPVNIDIIYTDTVYAVLINGVDQLLTLLPQGSTATVNPQTTNANTQGLIQLRNINLNSPNNINILDIVMKNTSSTQGYLMYSVYDVTDSTVIYMQSNTTSTVVVKTA